MRGIYLLLAVLATACSGTDVSSATTKQGAVRIGNAFTATPVADFQEPWAMTFLPDGRLLVTEKKGALKLLDVNSKRVGNISGVPQVAYGGQGGFGDVILHPQFAANSIVYVSYSEPGQGENDRDTNGAAVAPNAIPVKTRAAAASAKSLAKANSTPISTTATRNQRTLGGSFRESAARKAK